MKQRVALHTFLAVLNVAALGMCLWVLPRFPITQDQIVPLIVFTIFLIGVELFEVKTAVGAKFSPSTTIDLAVWAMLGPSVAILMELVGQIVGEGLVKRRGLIKILYNAPAMMLSVGAAGVVYRQIPWGERLDSPLFLLAALASQFVFSAITMLLAATVLLISEGKRPSEIWRSGFGWHFLSGFVTAPLSAFLIFSYQYAGLWSLLLFGIPLFTIWQTHKLFEQMKESHKNTVAALTTALEADEPYTHGHSYRVAQYALWLGRRLGMGAQELETLEYAGLLHDIGKIAITNDIVCKPARLTKEEFDILSAHPAIGGEIVEQMKFLEDAATMVRHHHERPDGMGYPDGLKGEEISLGSHILNVCDAIDAMTSNRPYRAALSIEQCVEELQRFRGTQFDTRVVDAFTEMVADGTFQIMAQADGSAAEIQRILRESAGALALRAHVPAA